MIRAFRRWTRVGLRRLGQQEGGGEKYSINCRSSSKHRYVRSHTLRHASSRRWETKIRRCAGWKKVIRTAPARLFSVSKWTGARSAPRRSTLRSACRYLGQKRLPREAEAMNLAIFFAELKRRNVYKVAIAYAVVAWLLMQIATQVFPFLEIPNWAIRLVIMLIVIGFPIALMIAWAFELTPEGMKRTEVCGSNCRQNASRNRAWIYVVIVAGAISVGLFFLGRYTRQKSEASQVAGKVDRGVAIRKSEPRSGQRLFR